MDDAAAELDRLLAEATGADPAIDRAVAARFGADGGTEEGWSGSVEACVRLLHRVLPGWSWHVGWAPSGVVPYARLRHGQERISAEGPTVPIALLRAILAARRGERDPPAVAPEPPPWRRPAGGAPAA
ncbi:MAG: hypothetical protein NZ555_13095 [Geminicoccaceae bacterium]|nr:hypothetical protein [Geminicoccaceae bacterium]MCX8100057.1 hypothetical protein [Geminicoccaceae bacterium]MDW8369231.1 hypothetical protein [Geminicoccaceae bacterium]